jgi:hypothetical protein
VKIIDIDLDRRRISLSRKQAVREAAPGMEAAAGDMELEVEAREASEDVGVPTEDTSQRPEPIEAVRSAAETAPEISREPLAPEVTNVDDAGAAAPPEEKEEAEHTAHMSPESPPEGREGLTAADAERESMEKRLLREEPDAGAAPGAATEELAPEEPTEAAAEVAESGTDRDESEDKDEESIESIVQDLKRERGQQ